MSKREAEVQGTKDGWLASTEDSADLMPQRATAAQLAKRKIARGRAPPRQLGPSRLNQIHRASSESEESTTPSPFSNLIDPNFRFVNGSLQRKNSQSQNSTQDNSNQQVNASSGQLGFGNTNNGQSQDIAPPSSTFNFSMAGTAPVSNPFSSAANTTSNAADIDYSAERNFAGFNGGVFYVPPSTAEEGARLRAARKGKGPANHQSPVPGYTLGNASASKYAAEAEALLEDAKKFRDMNEKNGDDALTWTPAQPFNHTFQMFGSNPKGNGITPTIDAFTGTTAGPSQPSVDNSGKGIDQSHNTGNSFGHREGSQQPNPEFGHFDNGVNQQRQIQANPYGQASSQQLSNTDVQSVLTSYGDTMDNEQNMEASENFFIGQDQLAADNFLRDNEFLLGDSGSVISDLTDLDVYSFDLLASEIAEFDALVLALMNLNLKDSEIMESELTTPEMTESPILFLQDVEMTCCENKYSNCNVPQPSIETQSTSTFMPTTNEYYQHALPASNFVYPQEQAPAISKFSEFSSYQTSKPTGNLLGNMDRAPDQEMQSDDFPTSLPDSPMLSNYGESTSFKSSRVPTNNIFQVASQSQTGASMGEQSLFSRISQPASESSQVPTSNIIGITSQSQTGASAGEPSLFNRISQPENSIYSSSKPEKPDSLSEDSNQNKSGANDKAEVTHNTEFIHNTELIPNSESNPPSSKEQSIKVPILCERCRCEIVEESKINTQASVKMPPNVPQTTSNSSLSSPITNTTSVQPPQPAGVPGQMSTEDTVQSGSSASLAGVQSSRKRDHRMTLMPPNIPDHFTEAQRTQFVVAYRLRSLDVGLKKHILASKSFSWESGMVLRFYDTMKQRILSAGAGQLISLSDDRPIEESSSPDQYTNASGPLPNDVEARPSAIGSQPISGNNKRRADDPGHKETASGVVDNGKKARGDTGIFYPTLAPQGSQTSKLFASIASGSTTATSSKKNPIDEERETNKPATVGTINTEPLISMNPPTFNAQSNGSSNESSPKRPMFPTSTSAAPRASGSSSLMTQGTPSASNVADGSSTSDVSQSSGSKVSGVGSIHSTASEKPSISRFGLQGSGNNTSTITSKFTNSSSFKVPNFGASQNTAPVSSGTPAFTLGSTNNKAQESTNQTRFKVPTFGEGNDKSSGSAHTPPNFMAQFSMKAEADAEKEKAKRKAEDFDSDEETEAEWERKDEEAQRAKRQKLAEQIADSTNNKALAFNPDKESNVPSQAGTNFMAQFGKKAKEETRKETTKRKADELVSDEDNEAEGERRYEEEQRSKKQKVAEPIAESSKAQKLSLTSSEAKSEQTKPSSGDGSLSDLDNTPKTSSAPSSAQSSSVNPTSSTSMGKSIFSALNKPDFQNSSYAGNIFEKYNKPGSNAEGHKVANTDDGESDVSDEDAETAPSQDIITKKSTSVSHSNPLSSSNTFSSKNNMSIEPNLFSPLNNVSSKKSAGIESTSKEEKRPVGRSLFDRIEHDKDGAPRRNISPTEEKESLNPFSQSRPSNIGSIFSQASPKGSSNPFTQSLMGQANSNQKTGNLFALPSSTEVGTSFGQPSSTTPSFTGFGSSTTSIGDHTWKPESPIKFGSTSAAQSFSITGASSSKAAFTEQKGSAASPFSGLFGSPKSGIDEAPIKPSSNIFGSAPAKPTSGVVGFGFGGPPKPTMGNFLAAPFSLTSTDSSRATSPGFSTGGESTNEATTEGTEDLMEHHEQINLAARGRGEANEDVIFEVKAKAQEFDTDKKEWVTRGVGSLRVLKHRETSKSRILMRQVPSGKIVLNAALMGSMKYEHIEEKRIKFGAATGSGKLTNWFIQVGKREDAMKLSGLLEENKSN